MHEWKTTLHTDSRLIHSHTVSKVIQESITVTEVINGDDTV